MYSSIDSSAFQGDFSFKKKKLINTYKEEVIIYIFEFIKLQTLCIPVILLSLSASGTTVDGRNASSERLT